LAGWEGLFATRIELLQQRKFGTNGRKTFRFGGSEVGHDLQYSSDDWRKPCEPEHRLTYVDALTGEWLEFKGEGWPTTDEEAELVLPRPPMHSRAALNIYYKYREDGLSIKHAIASVMRDISEVEHRRTDGRSDGQT